MERCGRSDRDGLEVRREFRSSRLAGQWAASAYELLVPTDRRWVGWTEPDESGSRWGAAGMEERPCALRA